MALKPLPVIQDELLHKHYSSSAFPSFDEPQPAALDESLPPSESAMDFEKKRMEELDLVLQEARGRAEIMEREAYDKAYAAGEKSGMALGEKRAEQTLDQLDGLLKQAELQLGGLEHMCREAVLDIAEAVVKQVLGNVDESRHIMLVQAIEREAFQFPDMNQLILMVNPSDLEAIVALLPGTPMADCRIHAQQDVEEGGCRLMSVNQDVMINPMTAMHASFDLLRQNFHA